MTATEQIITIPLDRVLDSPYQPRREYDQEALDELAASIRAEGQIQPATVREAPGQPGYYELIGGHRRKRACERAGVGVLRAVVVAKTDAEAQKLALLDNLQREDLTPWDEGAAYALLLASGATIDEISASTGKSATYVRARIQIAEGAGNSLRAAWADGLITMEALYAASKLPNRTVAAKECPQCNAVAGGDALACAACGRSLVGVMAWELGNPQDVAAKALKGRAGTEIKAAIAEIERGYGLTNQPVQTSFGLDVDQLSELAVEVKTKLGRMFERIGRAEAWFAEHSGVISEYSEDQLASLLAQIAVTERIVRRIREHVEAAQDAHRGAVA